MGTLRWAGRFGSVALLLSLGGPAPRAGAQATADPPRPQKSVYGTLESVDARRNAVVMRSKSGEGLAWRFAPAVVAEVNHFKRGDAMIVIYRPITPTEKRVTAVAFPGSAETAVYMNMTDARVILRSAPDVGGVCGKPDAGPVIDSGIPIGGMGEATGACWCCALSGKTCSPENKTGKGKALLVGCFE